MQEDAMVSMPTSLQPYTSPVCDKVQCGHDWAGGGGGGGVAPSSAGTRCSTVIENVRTLR